MDGDAAGVQSVRAVAFLWDESYLWGLMAYNALETLGLPFDLIRADDVKGGRLADYRAVFVPGGWASNKMKALGDEGRRRIRAFVHNGGSYFGLCGGAGLATLDGIGLLPLGRRPSKGRVPSFSGRIELNLASHPIWNGLDCTADAPHSNNGASGASTSRAAIFHVWWPSQFVIQGEGMRFLATYGSALPDAFSADLNVGDVGSGGSWDDLEKTYGILLDPDRLRNDPAVVEGSYGHGSVILSLVHFDTPGDLNGASVLRNLWAYLTGEGAERRTEGRRSVRRSVHLTATNPPDYRATRSGDHQTGPRCAATSGMVDAVTGLVSLGARNFLWFWRNPMLLQWRRGVRGLEYCTLYVLVHEIGRLLGTLTHPVTTSTDQVAADLQKIGSLLHPFVQKAKRLLLLERYAMQHGQITYERCDDPEIRALRGELFSTSKSYGGMFKTLIDEVDALLYRLLLQEERRLKETGQRR